MERNLAVLGMVVNGHGEDKAIQDFPHLLMGTQAAQGRQRRKQFH